MKINRITSFLSILLSGLIAIYLASNITGINKWILLIGGFVTISIKLGGLVSITFDYDKTTFLTRITSAIFLGLNLIFHIMFTLMSSFNLTTYLLIIGGTSILYLIIYYNLTRTEY